MTCLEIPNQQWLFAASKYLNDMHVADDDLHLTLDNISNSILVSRKDDNLSTQVDLLSTQ
jgi:hypothetical protein